jgi:putative transposase
MPRIARVAPGGFVYHVLNRSAGRFRIFRGERDFLAFERVLVEAHRRCPIRILSWCILSNHWHFEVWPEQDGQLSEFFRWLTHTHAMRWRVAHRTVGYGPLYQGRFKSFIVQDDSHVLTVGRYVERNALSAGLVKRAQDWRHCSLWARANGSDELKALLLNEWPIDRPRDWVQWVNRPLSDRELERLRTSVARGRPFGSDAWVKRAVARLGLQHTVRSEGRPRRAKKN